MKKIVKIISMLVFISIFSISCKKELEKLQKEENSSKIEYSTKKAPTVNNGILEFKNQNHFQSYMQDLQNGIDPLFADFKSYEIVFNSINRKDNTTEDRILNGELSNYYFLETYNGEASIVETISDPYFRKVLNENRMIIIDKTVYLIDKDFVFSMKFDENIKINKFRDEPKNVNGVKFEKVIRERLNNTNKISSLNKNGKIKTQSAVQDYHYNGTDFHCTAYIANNWYGIYRSKVFKIYHEYRRRAWIGWYWADIESPKIAFSGRADVWQAGVLFQKTLTGSVSYSHLLSFFLSEVGGSITHDAEVYGTVTYTRRDATWSSHQFSL